MSLFPERVRPWMTTRSSGLASELKREGKRGDAGSEPEIVDRPTLNEAPGELPPGAAEASFQRGDENADAQSAVDNEKKPGSQQGDNKSDGGRSDSDSDSDGDYHPRPYIQEIPVVPGQSIRLVLASPEDGKPVPKKEHPQIRMSKFWHNFEPEYEGGITRILPEDVVTGDTSKAKGRSTGANPTGAVRSYQQARDQCIKSVRRIIRECQALNTKYTDIHFDLERDLNITCNRDCLDGLVMSDERECPGDVKRVTDIFEKPQFYKDGAGFDDVVQGGLGDCWFLAAISALTTNEQFVRNVCVIQDQEVGVYGFVFYRDGDWQPCIIDDKLYMRAPSYDECTEPVLNCYGVAQKDPERVHRELFQTGSAALYFAACRDDNETWVPLLEKAFAKAHGDFYALSGGQTGEALEDLTGGVTTEIYTQNILSKERFWTDKLRRMGKDFIFSCAKALWVDDRVRSEREKEEIKERRKGLMSGHAYAILDTYEGYGKRLVKIRNPWGEREWKGAWSDGSKEWTAEWVQRLNHKFGDDGVFWISYEDMLQKYRYMDCTRIFGPEWHVVQEWARVQVPWAVRDYQQTKFSFSLSAKTEVIIVLAQLDSRYFKGLEGCYNYSLQFRIHSDDEEDEDEYIARSKVNYELRRSTNVELELEAGRYTVLFKVEANESPRDDIETVIRRNVDRKDKITQMATLYDLAHAKGHPPKKEKSKEKPKEESKEAPKEEPKETSESTTKPAEDSNPSVVPEKVDPKAEDKATNVDEAAQTTEEGKTSTDTEAKDLVVEEIKAEDKKPEEAKPEEKKPDEQPKIETQEDGTQTDAENKSNVPLPNDDDPDRNPWNAFCIVGLRVYSKLDNLELKVVWPAEERPISLDRDDIAKAALAEAEAEAAADGQEDS